MSKESIYFRVPDLSESHDAKKIKKDIDTLTGILSVSVNSSTKKVAVDFDSSGTNGQEIADRLEKLGYSFQVISDEKHVM